MAEQIIKIITQQEGVKPGAVPVTGAPSVAGELKTAFGDAVREFGQGLSGIIPTIIGGAVGRVTGSFTLGGGAATLAASTIRNIQAGQAGVPGAVRSETAAVAEGEGAAATAAVKGAAAAIPKGEAAAAAAKGGAAGIGASGGAAAIIPVVGAVLAGALILKEALSRVAEGLREMEENLAPFSADIAVARAEVNIRQIRSRIRRAQEFGPDIAEFVRARGEFAETIEDIKASLLTDFLPLIIQITRAAGPIVKGVGVLANIFTSNFELFGKGLEQIGIKNDVLATLISPGLTLLGKLVDNTTQDPEDVFKEITDFLTEPILDPEKVQIRLPVGRGIF